MTEPLDIVREARNQLNQDRERLRAAIADARHAGQPVPAIAEASGYTRQRIYQIIRELDSEAVTAP